MGYGRAAGKNPAGMTSAADTMRDASTMGPSLLRAALAVAKRLPVAPASATMPEAGLPGVEATAWKGICVPV